MLLLRHQGYDTLWAALVVQNPLQGAKLWAAAAIAVAACVVAGNLAFPSGLEDSRLLPLRIAVGQKAPDFSLPSADGKTVKLSDFAGHIVLIDFYRGHW